MNSNKIIKLKLDIIFKAMFGTAENEQLLANFLSSILEIPRESIKKIIMDNVELQINTNPTLLKELYIIGQEYMEVN